MPFGLFYKAQQLGLKKQLEFSLTYIYDRLMSPSDRSSILEKFESSTRQYNNSEISILVVSVVCIANTASLFFYLMDIFRSPRLSFVRSVALHSTQDSYGSQTLTAFRKNFKEKRIIRKRAFTPLVLKPTTSGTGRTITNCTGWESSGEQTMVKMEANTAKSLRPWKQNSRMTTPVLWKRYRINYENSMRVLFATLHNGVTGAFYVNHVDFFWRKGALLTPWEF